jgi:hypothetical protein
MAVTKIRLLNSSGGEGENSIEYQLRYLVTVDSRADGPLTVRSAVPWRKGDVYAVGNELDLRAKVKSIKETPVSSAHFADWFVDVTFSRTDTEKDTSNPLNDLPEAEMNWSPKSKLTWIDGNNKPVCNTAGEPFGDGLEVEDNLPTISYSINQAFYSESVAMAVRNAVNLTAWKGYAPLTIRLASIQARRMFHNVIGVYFQVHYTFAFDKDEIAQRSVSMGHFELVKDGAQLKSKRINVGGGPVGFPWPLDAEGKACKRKETDGIISWDPVPAEVMFLKGEPIDFNLVFGFL